MLLCTTISARPSGVSAMPLALLRAGSVLCTHSPVSGTRTASAGRPRLPSGSLNSTGLRESVKKAARPVSTTSLMKVFEPAGCS